MNDTAVLVRHRQILIEALTLLRIDANRLCDRMLGGSYEYDCRLAIRRADEVLHEIAGAEVSRTQPAEEKE